MLLSGEDWLALIVQPYLFANAGIAITNRLKTSIIMTRLMAAPPNLTRGAEANTLPRGSGALLRHDVNDARQAEN
jgi:hypothetical protein